MNEASSEQLEESLRGHDSLSGVEDFNALAKGYIAHGDTIKTLKGDLEGKVSIPGETSTDTDRHAFHMKLGKPETFDKYELEKFELPNGREPDNVLSDKIKKVAFDNHVSSSALKALHRTIAEHGMNQNKEIDTAIKAQDEKDNNALKNIWTGDTFKENNEKSRRVFDKLMEKMTIPEELGGKEAMLKEFKDIGFIGGQDGNEPGGNARLKFFLNNMFGLIGEDTIVEGIRQSSQGELSEDDRLKAKYPEMADK